MIEVDVDDRRTQDRAGRHMAGGRRRAGVIALAAGATLAILGALGLVLSPQAGAQRTVTSSPTPSQVPVVSPSPSSESLESRLKRDFLNDRDGMIRALSTGNILDLNGALADSSAAQTKFITISSENQFHHVTVSEEVQRTSVDVTRGTDPRFPSDALVVEERGYLRATTRLRTTGAVDGVQQLQIDDRYQMQEQGGRFAIADWDLSEQTVSVIPVAPSPSPSSSPAPTPSPTLTPGVATAGRGPEQSGSGSNRGLFLAMIVAGVVLSGAGGAVAMPASRVRGGTQASADVRPGTPSPWRLEIGVMGKLSVLEGNTDHAPELLAHPGQSILWFYLLVLAIDGSRPRRLRDEVSEEMWPKQRPETRRERMRSRLSQRKKLLPGAIAERILDDGVTVEFDLGACRVDAVELLALAKRCESDSELRSDVLRHAVLALLDQARGPFMEFWEELEKKAIEGESESATRVLVDELRGRLERCKVDLLLAVGRNALWRNQAGAGVNSLEEALELRPDREDVASVLAEVYDKVGRSGEARHLRETGGRG